VITAKGENAREFIDDFCCLAASLSLRMRRALPSNRRSLSSPTAELPPRIALHRMKWVAAHPAHRLLPVAGDMQKRHVVVGAVMLLSAVVSYGLVRMRAASPALELVESSSSPSMAVAAASPLLVQSSTVEFAETLASLSDTTMMLAAGVALLGLAAGVRRHS
jgi:hypothetical protein